MIVKRAVVGGVAAGVVALWLAVAGQPAVSPGGVAEARVATVAWTSPMAPSDDAGGSDDSDAGPKRGPMSAPRDSDSSGTGGAAKGSHSSSSSDGEDGDGGILGWAKNLVGGGSKKDAGSGGGGGAQGAQGGGGSSEGDGESLASEIMSKVSSGVSSMFKHITGDN